MHFPAPNLACNFSTISDGNMSFLHGNSSDVLANRRKFLSVIGVDIEQTVAMQVEHKDTIVDVDTSHLGLGMNQLETAIEADALITTDSSISLFLLTADCLPMYVIDPYRNILSLVHCGWKNLEIELLAKVIKSFIHNYNSQPGDLWVGIGPGISKSSYVQENPNQQQDPKWLEFLTQVSHNTYSVDLKGMARKQLVHCGVLPSRIHDVNIDTATSSDFYSHYRSKQNDEISGRFATVIRLK